MATKKKLIGAILHESRKAKTWEFPKSGRIGLLDFPPALRLDNGKRFKATRKLLDLVIDYARLCWANNTTLKTQFKFDEFAALARSAFANTLADVDIDQPDDELVDEIEAGVREHLDRNLPRHQQQIELTLGCHLFEGDDPYPIRVGPVIFETREQWRCRLIANGKLMPITARRLEAAWSGKTLRPRKPSADSQTEDAILRTIGGCPVVCTIETDGLSSKNVKEKGILAARLAMSALSLIWEQPSRGLEWMKLLYDRKRPNRYTVSFGEGEFPGFSSSSAEPPMGRWTDEKLILSLSENQWLFDQVGEALFNYVQPVRSVTRPTVMNALFVSLLWFHEATREPLDQIAVTKYAASMDALAKGGGAEAIVRLLGARLGYKPNNPLFNDGRSTRNVINLIYHQHRSRLIHGSSEDFPHDWSIIRSQSEVVARLCLTSSCDWFFKNKNSDDLEALQTFPKIKSHKL